MLVKKIIADNYAEALDRVKDELGQDALILSTRSIKHKGDAQGSHTSNYVEITAALEKLPESAAVAVAEPPIANVSKETEDPAEPLLSRDSEMEELKVLLRSLVPQTERARSMGLNSEQTSLYGDLVKQGIDEQFASRLMKMAMSAGNPSDNSYSAIQSRIRELTKRVLKCDGAIKMKTQGPRVVALVGPTGVGKTTTLAKLAAHFVLHENKKVALVSLDTYRMGAVEQLKSYGDLMELPLETCTGRLEFRKVIQKHSDKDLILVDTTGRNHRDKEYAMELKGIFRTLPEVEIHLVQSITTQESVMNESIRRFEPLKPDRLLFTKLDEGLEFGSLLNVAVRHRIPFSYLTAGQKVPEDIEVASKDRLIRLIFQ